MKKNLYRYLIIAIILAGIVVTALLLVRKPVMGEAAETAGRPEIMTGNAHKDIDKYPGSSEGKIKEAGSVPVYGNWRTWSALMMDLQFTRTKNGEHIQPKMVSLIMELFQ